MEEENAGRRFFHPRLFGAITIVILGAFVIFTFGHSDVLGQSNKKEILTAKIVPTAIPTPTITLTPTPSLTPSPSPTPTLTVTPTPSPSPTPIPTASPEDTAVWDTLAACETGGNWAEDTGNGYFGGLQFNQTAWTSVGGSGKPSDASRDEQILRGKTLQAQRGWGAWSDCAKRLGLY